MDKEKPAQGKKAMQGIKVHYETRVRRELAKAPWVLRITDHNDKQGAIFIIKEKIPPGQREDAGNLIAPRSVMKERGLLYGQQLLRCLPILRTIVARVQDHAGIPLELYQFMSGSRITFRGNLPLDDEAGWKIALIFKLQERIIELDRVELLARRVDRFTREEAGYWFSRITSFGPDANRWAISGMRIMLAGQSNDKAIETMLEQLRLSYQ